MRTARASVLLLFALLVAGACASGPRNPMEEERPQTIRILVDNQNFSDATVYTLRGGTRMRLGIVRGKSRGRFETQWMFPDIQLLVRFLAGGEVVTDVLPVSPGEELELILPASL